MRWYDLALFVHLLGLMALFGGFVLFRIAGARLRGATSTEEARTWLGLLDVASPMFPSGLIMLLATGLYMALTRWRPMPAWTSDSLGALVVMMLLGALVVDPRRKAIRKALDESPGPITGAHARVIRNATLWTTTGLLNGMALGVVFVMATKPAPLVVHVVIAGTAVLGALIGFANVRRRSTSPAQGP
jgi:hypothetical protein